MKKWFLFSLGATFIVACDAQPVVSDFNGDSVKIVTSQLANQTEASGLALAEANRICGTRSRTAEYVSVRSLPDTLEDERLYLCI